MKGGNPRKSKKVSPTKKLYNMKKTKYNYTGLLRNPLNRFWSKDKEVLQFKKENKL